MAGIFLRLIDLPDAMVMEIITIAIGETLASGSAAVAAAGTEIGIDMADWWQADAAFFELIRDKEVLGAIVTEVAGEAVAEANAGEKSKTLKAIVRGHLDGDDGRPKIERWVPRWMTFPPSAYAVGGSVGTVTAHVKVEGRAPLPARLKPRKWRYRSSTPRDCGGAVPGPPSGHLPKIGRAFALGDGVAF